MAAIAAALLATLEQEQAVEARASVQPINDFGGAGAGSYQFNYALQGPDLQKLDEIASGAEDELLGQGIPRERVRTQYGVSISQEWLDRVLQDEAARRLEIEREMDAAILEAHVQTKRTRLDAAELRQLVEALGRRTSLDDDAPLGIDDLVLGHAQRAGTPGSRDRAESHWSRPTVRCVP